MYTELLLEYKHTILKASSKLETNLLQQTLETEQTFKNQKQNT